MGPWWKCLEIRLQCLDEKKQTVRGLERGGEGGGAREGVEMFYVQQLQDYVPDRSFILREV